MNKTSTSTHFLAAFRATFSKAGSIRPDDGRVYPPLELAPFAFDLLEEAASKADRTARDCLYLTEKVARLAEADRARTVHAMESGDMLMLNHEADLSVRVAGDLQVARIMARDAYEALRDGIELADAPSMARFRAAVKTIANGPR